MLIVIDKNINYRGNLRARTVSATKPATLAAKAAETGEFQLRAAHGGTVPNCYKSPAETEMLVEIAYPPDANGIQHVIRYWAQGRANKATLSGVCRICTGIAAFDGRMNADSQNLAKLRIFEKCAAELMGMK